MSKDYNLFKIHRFQDLDYVANLTSYRYPGVPIYLKLGYFYFILARYGYLQAIIYRITTPSGFIFLLILRCRTKPTKE